MDALVVQCTAALVSPLTRISAVATFSCLFSVFLHLNSKGLKEVGNVCLMGNSIFLMVLRALKNHFCQQESRMC